MLNNLCVVSSLRSAPCSVICTISSRYYSNEIKAIKNPDISSLKRGTGGRSSFNGNVVTVFGATGFLGRHIINQLGKTGSQIIVPYRCDTDDIALKNLKLAGDLGQVLFQPFYLKDPFSVRKAIKYSNIVINLIGAHYETRNFDMYAVNVQGAREIAKACKEMNVEKLIHFSAMNVTDHPKRHFLKKSKFFPTKLKGEKVVMEEFPDATIFRPGSVCGFGDKFTWPLFCGIRSYLGLPIYKKGTATIKMPVSGRDISKGVMVTINSDDYKGKIIQAVGPEKYYLKDIVRLGLALGQMDVDDSIKDIAYDFLFLARLMLFNNILGVFDSKPNYSLNLDLIEMESTSDTVYSDLPILSDLVSPLDKFEDIITPYIIHQFSYVSSFPILLEDLKSTESLSSKVVSSFK